MNKKRLSVVIPAYNESRNIISTLKEVSLFLSTHLNDSWEMLVVDDGSSDNTCQLVEEFIKNAGLNKNNLVLLKNGVNLGKGAAVKKGMLAAEGDIRLFMDADNSTRITELTKMLPLFNEGAQMVISSRKLKDAAIAILQPLSRRISSVVYHLLVKFVLGTKVSDYNCGFKAFKADVAERLFSQQLMQRWVFDAELIFLAKRNKIPIREVGVKWEHKSTSKVRILRDTLNSLKGILMIKLNAIKGLYNH